MRTAPRPILLLLAAATLSYPARSAAAQASTVDFTIFAAETQAPLPGAQVSVDGRGRGVADAHGVVRVEGLSPGRHGASVSLIGRVPRGVRIDLTPGEEREVMVVMEPLSLTLTPVTASARARSRDVRIEDFYRRAQNHVTGRFVTRAQIEERNAVLFTDIFRDLPGVRVIAGPHGNVIRNPRAVSMVGGRARPGDARNGGDSGGPATPAEQGTLITGGGDCAPLYFVDGFPYAMGGSPDTELSPADVEGIEIYFGNAPPQWGGSRAMCGVIVIWTRTTAAPATRN